MIITKDYTWMACVIKYMYTLFGGCCNDTPAEFIITVDLYAVHLEGD